MREVTWSEDTPAPRWLAIAACIGAGLSVLALIAMAVWLGLQWLA